MTNDDLKKLSQELARRMMLWVLTLLLAVVERQERVCVTKCANKNGVVQTLAVEAL
jgi:hypothetical protein